MTKCGYLDTPAATGQMSVTGLDFKPNLIFFHTTMQSTDGSATDVCTNQGFALEIAGVITQYARSGRSQQNGGANCIYGSGSSSSLCIRGNETTATLDLTAAFVSFNDDGFTLNFTVVPASSRRVFYTALSIEKIATGTTSRSSIGSFSVTGLGFQPEALICLHRAEDSMNIGFADGTSQRSNCQRAQNGVAYGTTSSIWTSCGPHLLSGYGGRDDTVDLTSFDADGFTLFKNSTTATGPNIRWIALADVDKSFKVGTFQPPQTGTTTVSGLGFQPGALLMAGCHDLDISSTYNFVLGLRAFFAGVDGDGAQYALGGRGTAANAQVRFQDSDSATSRQTQLTNSHSFAFDPDGFTVQAISGSATTAVCAYMAFEEIGASGALPLLGVG